MNVRNLGKNSLLQLIVLSLFILLGLSEAVAEPKCSKKENKGEAVDCVQELITQKYSELKDENDRQKTRIDSLETKLDELVNRERPVINFFVKAGNNGTASCEEFCLGDTTEWWAKPKGTCVGAVFTNSSVPTSCNNKPGSPNLLSCVCGKIP